MKFKRSNKVYMTNENEHHMNWIIDELWFDTFIEFYHRVQMIESNCLVSVDKVSAMKSIKQLPPKKKTPFTILQTHIPELNKYQIDETI